jgi:ubiquinone/menaquinone biosynthesis C-methylase UbiE
MPTIAFTINVEETTYEMPTEWRMLGAQGKAEHILNLCERNRIRPERILEVGAGDGAILRCLSKAGCCKELHALEISQSGVGVILSQQIPGLMSCQTFDGYNLPFGDKSFDLIVLSHVLEHVEFERALLREIRRVSEYQVIEIPMDGNALKDETYHMLGPSYGHINAHTTDSLRFLLSTEGFQVVDQFVGLYSFELQEFNHFVNNSQARTPETIEQFRQKYQESEAMFAALPRSQQESTSSYYAVLTREEGRQERITRALKAIESSISAGKPQAARLIFDHYVPAEFIAQSATEIAEIAFERNPQIALEFVDRALAREKSNLVALGLRGRILQKLAEKPMASDDVVETQEDAPPRNLMHHIKETFPVIGRLVRAYRRRK